MTDTDTSIRQGLGYLVDLTPLAPTFDQVRDQMIPIKKRQRRIRRRIELVALAAVVIAGVIAGVSLSSGGPSQTAKSGTSGHTPVVDPKAGEGGFTVTPSTDLVNDQPVTVSIHGLHPNALVWITMCVGHPTSFQTGVNQCNAPAKTVNLDPQGGASIKFTVNRYLSPGGYEVDCATYESGCSVALVEADSLASGEIIANTEAVTFESTPPAPPNPLQISATPSGPYADGQMVTVSGVGFPSSAPVRVGECPTNTDCGDYFQTVQSTPQGTFVAEVMLHQTYTVEQGDAGGGESPVQIDCSQPLRCFLMAEEPSPPYNAASSIPLTFASTPTNTSDSNHHCSGLLVEPQIVRIAQRNVLIDTHCFALAHTVLTMARVTGVTDLTPIRGRGSVG